MALTLYRGKILSRIRPQTLTLTLNKCLRPPSSANPTEDSDQIKSLASYVTTKIDEIIKFGKPPLPLVYGAEVYLDTSYADIPEVSKLKIISKTVVDYIQNIPEVDKIQIFNAKVFYRSMLNDDSENDLTKDDIISRVVNVTQSYPKVGGCKVTEETHFLEDLGFDKWDFIEIIQALQMEFKLYIPDDIVSCKLAINYIYDHRSERLSKEEFRKCVFLTGEFGESRSELRRIFVRDKEMGTNYDNSDSRSLTPCPGTTNGNVPRQIQYFRSILPFSVQWVG